MYRLIEEENRTPTSTPVGAKQMVAGNGDRRDEMRSRGDGGNESNQGSLVAQVSVMKWPDSCHCAGVLIVSDDEEDEEGSDDGEMA